MRAGFSKTGRLDWRRRICPHVVPLTNLIAALMSATGTLFAQNPANPDTGKSQVTITELFPPAYPPPARQTRIAGNVHLERKIRPDGGVSSLEVVSGHPLLTQAALESAKQSHFRCTNCSENLISYRLVYTFQFVDTEHCCSTTLADLPKPSQSENHITVVTRPMCLCGPAETPTKVRSIKCLYLWHCSVRYPA
jgi:TonB family protein